MLCTLYCVRTYVTVIAMMIASTGLLLSLIVSISTIHRYLSFTSIPHPLSRGLLSGHHHIGIGRTTAIQSSLWDQVVDQWNNVLKSNNIVKEKVAKKEKAVDLTIYDEDISKADSILRRAAVDKSTSPDEVIEQLLNLEKLMRLKNKLDEGATSRDTIRNLSGAWRLVFTTGTIDTQKKIGKINYFPIKAVQTFNTDTTPYTISNGIYAGTFPLLR